MEPGLTGNRPIDKVGTNREVNLLFKEEVFQVIGAAIEVHKTLGFGFLEPVYQEALEMEFCVRNIPYSPQREIAIHYKGNQLEKRYIADFVVFDKIILELNAVDALESNHISQVINYLKATGFSLGLLVNFGSKSLEWKRIIH